MMAIEVETDSPTLKNVMQSNEWDGAPEGMFHRQLKFFLASSINDVIFSHISHSSNGVAHRLAREGVGLQLGMSHVWLDNYPTFVTKLFANDSTLSLS
jgi:hypothetical protein